MNPSVSLRNQHGCPAPDELSAFYFGKLPPAAVQELAEHLDHCSSCQSSLHALEGKEDPLVAGLRGSDADEPFADEPECRAALDRAQAFGRPDKMANGHGIATIPGSLGQYEVLRKLGQGGMGTVYLAMHNRLKREVALKVLPSFRERDEAAVARFRREMEAVGKLDHPNIVRATDAGEAGETSFLVMEFVDGIDLSRLARSCGKLSAADACEIIRQAALGLQHAHEHGLVHRDVKPSNLLLTSDGRVKVLDLGLALLRGEPTAAKELTATGQVLGTFDYMAPEQADDTHAVDIRADVYSLGCTLYRLLAGRAPFSGPGRESFLSKLRAHALAPVPPIRDENQSVPAGLAAVIERMLAKDPADRFATPADVAAALDLFTAGCDLQGLAARAKAQPDPERPDLDSEPRTDEHLASALVDTHSSGQRTPAPAVATPDRLPAGARSRLGGRRAAAVLVGILFLGAGAIWASQAIRNARHTAEHGVPVVAMNDAPQSRAGIGAGGAAQVGKGIAGQEGKGQTQNSSTEDPAAVGKKEGEAAAAEEPAGEKVYPTAVFAFEERGSGVRDYGARVTDLLFARLALKPELFLVERENLKKALAEQELGLSGAVKPSEAAKVGQLTGARLLVTGSVVAVDKKVYLIAKVIGTETSRVVAASADGKASDELAPLVDRLADKLAEAIAKNADKLVARAASKADRLAALKKALGKGKRPAVLVQVTEQHVGVPVIDPAAQTELSRYLKDTGFELIDAEEGARGKADVLLKGEGISELAGRHGNLVSVRARVEVKAIDRVSGKVLAVDRQTAVVVGLTEQIGGKQALQQAAAAVAERMLPKLVRD